ncbi:MAG: hypothetical protein ACC645_24800, partial [Pirellulales bacterium]
MIRISNRRPYGAAALLGLLLALTQPIVRPANLAAQEADRGGEPVPIAIDRKNDAPEIPSVPRDQVICFALYTVHDRTLKLSAQLYPLAESQAHEVALQVFRRGTWEKVAESPVDRVGYLATFRVEAWDTTRDYPYRVTHADGARYEGRIRKDPVDQDEIVVAAFTGNSNTDRGPRADIVANI